LPGLFLLEPFWTLSYQTLLGLGLSLASIGFGILLGSFFVEPLLDFENQIEPCSA